MGNWKQKDAVMTDVSFRFILLFTSKLLFAQQFRARNLRKARMKPRARWLLAFFFSTGLAETVVSIPVVYLLAIFLLMLRTSM